MSFDRDEIQQRIAAGGPIDLSGRDLSGADLTRLDLRRADLSRADLTGADLRWAVLEGANLRASVLRRADARWSILKNANLAQADLGGANLGWAEVTGADLTDAVLDGARLENVDLASVFVARKAGRRAAGGVPGATGGFGGFRLPAIAVGQLSPAVLAGAAFGLIALVHLWGWLFRRAYFVGEGGFALDAALVGLGQGANLAAGLKVIGLMLELVIAAPLALLALLLVLAAALALPGLAYLLALRMLQDVARPAARLAVIGGLFLVFSTGFFLLVPEAVRAAGLVGDALPTGPRLSAVMALYESGGWLTKLVGLGLVVLVLVPAWVGLRWLAHRATGFDVPVRWRLRYPGLNRLLLALRHPRLAAATRPVTPAEQRRGLLGLAALVAVLGFWSTGVGRVYAQRDMCDGGRLPRAQFYALPTGAEPGEVDIDPTIDLRDVCGRILMETAEGYHVFFPSETDIVRATGRRRAQVYAVAKDDVGLVDKASGENECPTCSDGPSGLEQALIDPGEARVAGIVDATYQAGSPVIALEIVGFDGATPMVQIAARTRILSGGRRTNADAIQSGRRIVAYGRLAGEADSAYLDAREIRVLLPGEADPGTEDGTPSAATTPAGPPATIDVDLSNPAAPRISGMGYQPGAQLEVAIADVNADPLSQEVIPLISVTAGPDGTFDAPIAFNPVWPTGSDLVLIVRDPARRQAATGAWLSAPPPTPTIRPPAVATVIGEETPTPEAAEATEEPLEDEATNTPFPTMSNVPGGGGRGAAAGCTDPDDFEFDDGLGFEKELPISFGEGARQTHNFCSAFDLDLVWFPVKAGRHYRIFTSNLAPGVDTVMALGNLPADTPCQPFHPTWGCWSDDKSALSFESEITFSAISDGRAIITLDNRGSASGGEASYDVAVVQFEPEPTTTPTLAPTNTATVTPTATRTPLPFPDMCDRPGSLDGCRYACLLTFNEPHHGVIHPGTDVDWFQIDLDPGQYRVTLDVPTGQNYDLELFDKTSATVCEATGLRSALAGDADEALDFEVTVRRTIAFRVDTYYTTVFGDAFNPYTILVSYRGTPAPGTIVATIAVPTPTASASASITPVPTATPTVPVAIPPTWTPLPPSATPTELPSPPIPDTETPDPLATETPTPLAAKVGRTP